MLFWGLLSIVFLAAIGSHIVLLGLASTMTISSIATCISEKSVGRVLTVAAFISLLAFICAGFYYSKESTSLPIMICGLSLAELFVLQVKLAWDTPRMRVG
jgi:hypothetical protein